MRVVVLVDGEHYPPVVRAAIGRLRARGDDVVSAVFMGGSEKLRDGDLDAAYGIAVEHGADPGTLLVRALDAVRPDAVLDLSDEPVVSAVDRFRLASLTLLRGVRYVGPDFELRPPRLEPVLSKPSIRVIATGKRTGKTAIAGALARHAAATGRTPVIVAMGRGGPDTPVVLEEAPQLEELFGLMERGLHAASDYIEDAVTSAVTTIGCRRVGGGLAGGIFDGNVVEGARIAESRPEDLVVLEGSGAAIPPVATRATALVVPVHAGPDDIVRYLGPFRVLLSDLVIVTMCEDAGLAAELTSSLRSISEDVEVLRTAFRPRPLGTVRDARVFYSCTAPPRSGDVLRRHLEDAYGCEVVGMSHALSDRTALEHELAAAPPYDVLVTEVKAAGIEVAARIAAASGHRVVFVDNEPVGDGIEEAFDRLLAAADRT